MQRTIQFLHFTPLLYSLHFIFVSCFEQALAKPRLFPPSRRRFGGKEGIQALLLRSPKPNCQRSKPNHLSFKAGKHAQQPHSFQNPIVRKNSISPQRKTPLPAIKASEDKAERSLKSHSLTPLSLSARSTFPFFQGTALLTSIPAATSLAY